VVAGVGNRQRVVRRIESLEDLRGDVRALVPALVATGLMLVWAVHNGGFDADTWYWGALVLLSVLVLVVVLRGRGRGLPRVAWLAVAAFGGYVAWSFASMLWAQVPGQALDGSNRALLYLIVFTVFLLVPWTTRAALVTLVVYAVGVGVIAIVLEGRLLSGDQLGQLVVQGRLAAPTGYFNSTVALFMSDALLATALACRRELPAAVRGLLLACAAASLQLCLLGESRGWLFTLPLVLLAAVLLVRDRLRTGLFALVPIAAVLIPLHRLLDVFSGSASTQQALTAAAESAARPALILCCGAFAIGTLGAWSERFITPRPVSTRVRRSIGVAAAALAVCAALAGGIEATGGHPLGFIERQWNGFSHQESSTPSGGSHFAAIGSGRYDFWRVALQAFDTHPLGGIGQDNFADYYILRRRTGEDPLWPHSLELRLLAMTGAVGATLFALFLGGALWSGLRARRREGLAGGVAASALLPLVVWILYGSVDWFFEMPALSGPALGFLGMAAGLSARPSAAGAAASQAQPRVRTAHRAARGLGAAACVALLGACTVALAFPYLSVREVSMASDAASSDPPAALSDLARAASLDPWNPAPGRLAGEIDLTVGRYRPAEAAFRQTIEREPDGWYAWLGAGLAASALGDDVSAAHYLHRAFEIDGIDPVIRLAFDRVLTPHPLTPARALDLLAAESGV
jgi:hypothetical protein